MEQEYFFLIAAVLTVLVLLLVSGCGAKKRVPEEVGKLEPDRQIELEPGQQRIADWRFSASERPDLIPIYSFNGGGLWLAKKHSSDRLGGAERLSLWQDLRFRFSQEAIAAPLPE